MKKTWIKIFEANSGHHELLEEFDDVLSDMGIDIYRDEEEEEKQGVDMIIRLEKKNEQ